MKRFSWLLLFFPVLFACVNNKTKENNVPINASLQTNTTLAAQGSYYFTGDFMYFADAATFKDCITGTIIPVAMQGAYKDVEKKYLKMKMNDAEGIFGELMGYIIDKPSGEEGHPKQLVITSLINFDQTSACRMEQITDSVYVVYIPDKKDATEKISLTLNSDYTFQSVTYTLKTKEQQVNVVGNWHRTSDEDIVFLTNGEVYYQGIIDFNTMNLKLVDNNNTLLVFKKEV